MKVLIGILSDTFAIEVEDAFVWTGLKEAPSWLTELVEDGTAIVYPIKKSLGINYLNGMIFYDKGDLVIRRSKDEYEVVRRISNL